MANGALCYKLNKGDVYGTQIWYQNIDNGKTTDASPVLDKTHGTVYGGEDQCPRNTYSNTLRGHDGSIGDDGFIESCTNERCYRTHVYQCPSIVDGIYQIANKGNLIWFAQQVNAGQTGINGRLTADIDMGDDQTMIGTSTNMYAATFDGNGYCVTVNYTATEDITALFRYVGNSTIKNLMTSGTITTSGRLAAGVVGKAENVRLERVMSNVTIDSSHSGDSSHGGLVAEVSNGSFTNCAFIGKLLGENTSHCGGLVGWVVYSSNFIMTNCYVDIAEQTISTSNCTTLSRNYNYKILNCYYVTALGSAQGTQVAASAVTDGSLVDKLDNTVWSQDSELGAPVPFFLNSQFGKYLKLTALEDGSITIQQTGTVTATLEYLAEGATAWTDVTYDTPISLTEGSGIYLRAKGVNGKNAKLSENIDNYLTITSTMDFEASQNIMSLLDASCKLKEVPGNAFYKLFYGCSHLTQTPELPATVLHDGSYQSMFQNCTSLTTIPNLSHVTVPYDCKEACKTMFSGCSKLKVNTLGLGSEWVIQTENEYADKTYGCFFQIFSRTGGNFTGRPQKDVVYYIYDDEPYTRSMANEWETVVLPFDVDYDDENLDYKLYHLTAVDSDNLKFTEFAAGTIPAGTPMVVKAIGDKGADDKYLISIPSAKGKFSGNVTEQNNTNAALPMGWTMTGTYNNRTGKTGIYYIDQDQFWWAEEAVTIPSFCAWFVGPEPTGNKVFNIVLDDGKTTPVRYNTISNAGGQGQTYNIMGQRVSDSTRGLVIKDGKKILVK